MTPDKRPQRPRIDWSRADIVEAERPRCNACGAVLRRFERYQRETDGTLTRRVVCECGTPSVVIMD